nr:phospholipase D family protein [Azotobacter salinestris]
MDVRPLVLLALLVLAGCTGLVPREPSETLPARGTWLGDTVQAEAGRHPAGQSGFRLLVDGGEAFAARAELIRRAQRSLDLQYYIAHDGLSTRLLTWELLQTADRGVRVRILLDDTTSDGRDHQIAVLAAHPNIQIRLFNPLHLGRAHGLTRTLGRLLHLSRQHRRMHNKLWLTDGSVAIVGGRNLGDEYFDAEPELNFADIDLLGAGPVAAHLAHSFDQYWNSALSVPIQQFLYRPPSTRALARLRARLQRSLARANSEQPALHERLTAYRREAPLRGWLEQLTWAHSQALWDAPAKVLSDGTPEPHLLLGAQLASDLQQVSDELIMISAYLVPTAGGFVYLTSLADDGVRVTLLTNSLEATDVPIVHGGYAPYRKPLLEHGVRLYELRRQGDGSGSRYSWSGTSASALHSKAAIFDRRKVFIGSLNFDPRSLLWNTEVGVLVDSPVLAGRMRELALEGMQPTISYAVRLRERDGQRRLVWIAEDNDRRRVLETEPGTLWRHFNAWLAQLIGLENML